MRKTKTVSAIVPVFDEEKTVGNVVQKLINHLLIDEVVCVDDGSKDNSPKILKEFGKKITLIRVRGNKGKGYALAIGISKAKGEIVVFFDADLIRFSTHHVNQLLKPILTNSVRAVLGYPMPTNYHLFALLSRNNTGERAYYKKDLLPFLGKMKRTRFGVEVFLNNLFPPRKIKKVALKRLTHLFKHEKYNTQKALKEYLKMGVEITEEVGKREGFLKDDFHTLKAFEKLTDFRDIRNAINKVKGKRMKKSRYISTKKW